jgi:hypothetical protein
MTLEDKVKQKLNAAQYEGLTGILGITQHRLTKIMNSPSEMNIHELTVLANLMGVDYEQLIVEHDAGKNNITIGEYMRLRADRVAKIMKSENDGN